MSFGTNGASHEAPPGVVRIGETVPATFPVLIAGREYRAYVWGKRMPRTQEALIRQASLDLDLALAQRHLDDEQTGPYLADQRLIVVLRELLKQYQAGAALATDVVAALVSALLAHAQEVNRPSVPSVLWQRFLNGVLCGLVDGLSPLQADLLDMDEVRWILREAHYPGFWEDPNAAAKDPQTATTTTMTSPTGSTTKPESLPSPISALPNNAT